MIGRSRLQHSGSAQGTANTVVSLVMLIAASVSNAYAQTKSPTAAWIQVGSGTGPAKVTVVAASALGATVTVEVPGIQTELVAINGAQYLKLAIPGTVSAGLDVGKPEVPAVPVLLARPTGSTVTLSVLSIQTETLHVARVFPLQPPLKMGEQPGPLVVDGSFYASDVEYPSDRMSSPHTATWRDLDVVNVHVYPVAVRPAQHEVVVTSRITFRVDFSGGSYPRTVASWMPPLYRRLIQNYDELRLTPAAQEPPGTKCLVFCDNDYVDNPALLALLDTMTMLGDSTEIISVAEGQGYVPRDPYAIKDTIMARYTDQNHALHWVFLVGEYDQVPPRQDYAGAGYVVPWSDVWYSDLDPRGYGYEDSCDYYPEVGIARLSPESGINGDNDLSNQIAKIEAYMKGRGAGDWLNTTTLVANKGDEEHDPTPVVREAAQMPLTFYPDITRDTLFGYKGGVNNADVKNCVEQGGTGVLIYLGHGKWDLWRNWNTYDEDWRIHEVSGLNNQRTPVVFNIACRCCSLAAATCLSEQWMRRCGPESAGAVASFGCSGTAWAYPADTQCIVVVRATGDYWEGVQHGQHHYEAPVFDLGGIQMLMDAYIATLWSGSFLLSNIYSFMWLGNPAMQVWSGGTPEAAVVSYPSQIPTGTQSFHVSVMTSDDHPVEGAQVCAYKPGDFYVVGLTDDQGGVTLDLNASSVGLVRVSASGGHERLSDPQAESHTPMLPYFGMSVVGGASPPYHDGDMTSPNWGRKLVRELGTNTLHVVYTGNETVFYTRSSDDGATWSEPEPIGPGTSPAIVLNGFPVVTPWVVYRISDGSILRAIRSDGAWSIATIFQSSPVEKAGAPSLAAGCYGERTLCGNVTYPVYDESRANNYICYNLFTSSYVLPRETLDAVPGTTPCYGASVAVTPLNWIHVAWIRGQRVIYREHRYSVWSDTIRISSPITPTEPASNPSVEAYGDSIFCVWRGPYDEVNLTGEIWRRSRWLSDPVDYWRATANQSESPELASDFPVMTTSFATVWHEQVSTQDNTDIWGRFLPDMVAQQFFQSQLRSWYPHVDGYWVPDPWTFKCNTVWTEQLSLIPPQFAVVFGERDWTSSSLGRGLGPSPHEDYEPASYYAAELGLPERSPYCLSRGGFAQFENWNADTSVAGLTYKLPYLNPRRTYKLRAVLYHEGEGTWSADLRCDSGPWHRIKVRPHTPDTLWLQVPKALYKNDARIVVEVARMTGGYVSLAKLKLFQIEEEMGGDEGEQSWGSGMTFVTRLRNCMPNPFAKGTSVNYELAQYGPVELTVRDVSGRLVRRLESGTRQRGFHAVRWDGTDDRGQVVPAGVYFVRYSAGGTVSTGRLTLVR